MHYTYQIHADFGWMAPLNPRQLRTFLAVRKHRSYTRAGAEVFLSQPAVSRQIQGLEQELEVCLFEKVGKSVRVTDAGETLAKEAEKILGSMERAREAVRGHRSAATGTLRVGGSTTPGLYLLPPLLGRLHTRLPGVELHYVVESSRRIEQRIVRNELDLALVGVPLGNTDLRQEPIFEDEIVCFASATHPLARRRRIDPRSLESEICVTRERESATRELFESWLVRAGGRLGRRIELQGPEEAKAIVAAGVGFSFASVSALRGARASGTLKKLSVSGLVLKRAIYLVRHADKPSSPVMEAFLSLLRSRRGGRARARSAGEAIR